MAAELQSPVQLQNFAPIRPLLELKSGAKKPDSRISKAIQEKYQTFHRKDRDVFREICNVGHLVNLFINGNQYPIRNPATGGWGWMPIRDMSNAPRTLNVLGNLKTNLLGKWENSNPDILIRPGRNLDTAVSAAKAADTVNNYYERQFYNHWFSQQEGLMGMTFGTYIDRYRYDDAKVSMTVIADIFEQRDATFGEGIGWCVECGHSASPQEFQSPLGGDGPMAQGRCPQCNSTTVDIQQAPTGSLNSVTGQRQHQIGDLVCELLPMPACRWDLSKRPEESSWFIYSQEIPKGSIQRLIGNVIIPEGNPERDYGLDVLRALGHQGQSIQGRALQFDTPIATPEGWKEIWELQSGDEVFSDSGQICEVTANSGIAFDRPCYEVEFEDGSVIIADEDHLWRTFNHAERERFKTRTPEWRLRRQSRRRKEWQSNGKGIPRPDAAERNRQKLALEIPEPLGSIRTTKEIAETLLLNRKTGRRWNHAVLNQFPIDLPDQDLPIDPYLLGAWLGDGTSAATSITIGDRDIEDASRIMSDIGVVLTKRSARYVYGLGEKKLRHETSGRFVSDPESLYSRLRQLDLLGNKHIPASYLRGSIKQRLALLQGLMDTDGYAGPDGINEFSNSNFQLCEDFTELISSLGIRGRYRYRPSGPMKAPNGNTYTQQAQRRITFRSTLPVFRLRRKLAAQKKTFYQDPKWLRVVDVRRTESVPVCCIAVNSESHCYLAGRTMIPTHNSSFGNDGRRGNESEKKDSYTFTEFWMSADDYADINLLGDEETVEGEMIPKGKLTDVFPDGLCAVGLNGMSVILALYPEQHRKHIVSGTWFMQTATGAGRGLADSVEIQKQFNTLNNQALEYMSGTYSPAIMYNNQILTGNKMKYIGTPRTNIPVDLTKLPEGQRLSDAIHQFQPTAMPNQFFSYAQNFLNVMFQKTSGVSDFANGEPGITAQNTTATAAEIDQGNADSFNQPIWLIKADCRKRGAEITVDLFRRHFPMKRYFDIGGEYGYQQGVELSGADLKADLVYDVARNSEMPKGPYQKQKNRSLFMNAVGGGAGLSSIKESDPETLNDMKQEFDVDMPRDEFDAVNELCLRRLQQMRSAERTGVDIPQVLIMAIQPPISDRELDLKKKSEWFARWLSTDQGIAASMPLRQAVELLVDGQFQGSVQQDSTIAAGQGSVMAAQMAPAAIGQAQLEQQPEQQEPDPSAQLQFMQEQSTQKHEAEQNALDRQHEKDMLDKEESKDKSVSKAETADKIRLEQSKPKVKPKAAGK